MSSVFENSLVHAHTGVKILSPVPVSHGAPGCAETNDLRPASVSFPVKIKNYLRCERNFPVACPDPSQPGIGHLQEGQVSLIPG